MNRIKDPERVAIAKERFTKHGKSGTSEYISWSGMKTRCDNPKCTQPQDYHQKGITYDPRWADFEVFLADMGTKPSPKHSLDRRDGNLGYNKSNCRWATSTTQNRNRDFNMKPVYLGETYRSLTELAEMLNFPYYTLRSRLRYGWSIENAVETPIRKLNKKVGAK